MPLAPIVNVAASVADSQGWAPVPDDYQSLVGCRLTTNGYAYGDGSAPVTGYKDAAKDISCGEDFAASAAWYVTHACELRDSSSSRYAYLRDEVFDGKEYIPEGGCDGEEIGSGTSP